ncbi:MAG: acetolactate synthase small subunit [delta proteobacterium ML8_F1]|nr:MAG: acetolactate synthase small subunit [delta proteobacterium ML8_F1]
METKHMISLLVENNAGVLSRIAGLFTRRGYNIDSLTVGETQNPRNSRMTIVMTCDEAALEQIKKQFNKLIEVIKVTELSYDNALTRELILVKLEADEEVRSRVIEIANIFRARIIDVTPGTLTVEMTGDEVKISGFLEMVRPFGVLELVRSGFCGIERG